MLLDVKNLQVAYGKIKALHGIDFHINDGEIVTIIGANGAGKSSTLRAISRLVPSGADTEMTFSGENLLKYPPEKVVSKLGITHVPEGRRLFGNLTVLEIKLEPEFYPIIVKFLFWNMECNFAGPITKDKFKCIRISGDNSMD